MIDHAEEHTLPMILENGFWTGLTLYPQTKVSPERAIDMFERYGTDRICVASACDWGPSLPDAVPHFALAMRRRGHAADLIDRIIYHNPIAFLGQSPKFDVGAAPRTRGDGGALPRGESGREIVCGSRRGVRRTVALLVVGLTSDLIGDDTPHLARLRRARRAATAAHRAPRGHLLGAGDVHHRAAAARPRRRRQRLVLPRPVGGAALAAVEPPRRRREDLGRGAHAPTRASPARSSSGGTTCTAARTTRSRRARCTPPTAARSPTSTRSRPLRDELNAKLGAFPLFNFWGPRADIASSRWIADCARHVYDTRQPTLTLVYLPHLDYDLQRLGPGDPSWRAISARSTRSAAS